MLLPFYWCKCNPETLSVFSNIISNIFLSQHTFFSFFWGLLMSSVTSCENKRLGSIPINFFKLFFSCLEIVSCLFSITVLCFEGRFIMKFHGYHFV